MSTVTIPSAIHREPELLGQTVVVIGGSADIGFETARHARAEGAKVILTGRNAERLQHAASEVDALSTAAFHPPTSGPAARSFSATALTSTSRCIRRAARRQTLRKVRAASGSACTMIGLSPTTSSSRRPTPTYGEARPATLITSHAARMARPTST